MPKVKLTEQFIRTGLNCPPDKSHIEYCDTELPGFIADVHQTSQGVASYKVRYKSNNTTAYHSIGRSSTITLKDARAAAKKLKAEIQLGRDPQAEARAGKVVLTWDEYYTQRYEPYAKPGVKSFRNHEKIHRLRISPAFGHVRLNRITRHQIEQVHQGMLDTGLTPASCNEFVKVLRRALNLAVEWELLHKNPAAKVKPFHEDNLIQRFLTDDELQRLTSLLESDKNRMVCNVILLLLSTGARVNEALSAQWQDIDRKGRTWTVQARNSKSGRVRRIPLSDAALKAIDAVKTEGKHTHIFVNSKTGNRLTTIAKVWTRLRNKAGMPDLRLHDLRHNFASMLVNAGVPIYTVKELLGHSDISVTERYAHLAPETQQKAADIASSQILGMIEKAAA